MIEPIYNEDGITLYTADCTDVLPLLSAVDMTFTDPPYGVGKMVSGTMSKARLHKTRYDCFEYSEEYVKNICVPIVEQCIKISKRTIVTPGFKCLKYYPQWDSWGCFYSPASVGMQLWGFADSQPIIYYRKPLDIGKRIHKCSYILTERPSCDKHPCSKPLKAWKMIIENRSKEGETILDPFAGSGTTLVAAKRLHRKAVGIEISEAYCQIAIDRLRQKELF